MMKYPLLRTCLLSSLLALTCARAQVPAPAPTPAAPMPAAKPDASVGQMKANNPHFLEKHQEFLARGKAGPIGVLFLGDSITEGWGKAATIFKQSFGAWQPANFGIGGDQTMHVIWRIEQGELDGITPKVVVLMLGTNNTAAHTGAEIAAADTKIVEMIRAKIPGVKVLLLAVFPRGPRAGRGGVPEDHVARMAAITEANAQLARLDDGKNVRFLDIGPRFLAPDGSIPKDIMPDQLHLSEAGYRIWADAMLPLLTEMMGGK